MMIFPRMMIIIPITEALCVSPVGSCDDHVLNRLTPLLHSNVRDWCEDMLHGHWRVQRCEFQNQMAFEDLNDATLFKMRWIG